MDTYCVNIIHSGVVYMISYEKDSCNPTKTDQTGSTEYYNSIEVCSQVDITRHQAAHIPPGLLEHVEHVGLEGVVQSRKRCRLDGDGERPSSTQYPPMALPPPPLTCSSSRSSTNDPEGLKNACSPQQPESLRTKKPSRREEPERICVRAAAREAEGCTRGGGAAGVGERGVGGEREGRGGLWLYSSSEEGRTAGAWGDGRRRRRAAGQGRSGGGVRSGKEEEGIAGARERGFFSFSVVVFGRNIGGWVGGVPGVCSSR